VTFIAEIQGMHYCLPKSVLGNAELVSRFGARAITAIEKMSGIRERRIANDDVTSVDLATFAAEQIFRVQPDLRAAIDTVIFCSQTGDYLIPPSSCVVHGRLGLNQDVLSFDIQHGCPSFAVGLAMAKALIESGARKKVLLINADTLTKLIDPEDRSLVPLHGDGAVVTIVGISGGAGSVGRIEHGTDGTGCQHLMAAGTGFRRDSEDPTAGNFLAMNGPAVFQFSLHVVPEAIERFLTNGHQSISAFDTIVFHQANKMMLDGIYDRIGAADSQKFYFLEEVGNTSAASLPMALAHAIRIGAIAKGAKSLFATFGVGLAWGVGEIEWGEMMDMSSAEITYE
jgi:3-oxoacyl-[acyl-carrier-protein] synthase III